MTKSAKYIIAIIVLLIANLWLFYSGSNSKSSERKNYFVEEDLNSSSKFLFATGDDTVKMELTGDGWVINESYLADEGFVTTLISILKRVEVGRSVGTWEGPVLGSVEVEYEFNSRYRFQFTANLTKTKSYFIVNGEAWEVAVPGYRDQVIDMFELHPDQWRSRLIFDGSWRTIQNIQVASTSEDNFQITFKDEFFAIDERPPVDSTAVVNYLNQFQNFTANEMISPGRFTSFDSLSETTPIATVQIDDIKYEEEIVLKIFPSLEGQRFHLVQKSDSILMVIDSQRVRNILSNPDRVN